MRCRFRRPLASCRNQAESTRPLQCRSKRMSRRLAWTSPCGSRGSRVFDSRRTKPPSSVSFFPQPVVRMSGYELDSVPYVREGSCTGGTEVGCANDFGNLIEDAVTVPVTGGRTYFIFADANS